jgi:phospholipid/cholesterol/gamma-HCH transport system substrate-binding protein
VVPERQTVNPGGGTRAAARLATVGALLVGFVLVLVVLFGSSSGRTYHLLFENGGQLVSGNQVLVAGQPIGKIKDVTLTDDGQAEVTISVDRTLHEGTTAVIRATSLSGVANRYVSITPGPNNAPELHDGATFAGDKTTSPVDLDQLFNTFRPRTRTALRQVIQGFATTYAGHTGGARLTYKYLAPSLSASRRLFAELTRDQQAFSEFLVHGSRALGAIAERRSDLSALTSNANRALGAIASQNNALDRSLVALPPALRQADTTFVNLRAALDDLDPLVAEAKPATRDLAPFLRKLRPVAEQAVPVVQHLRLAIARNGGANDLTDALRDLPEAHAKASAAVPRAIQALDDSQPLIQFARPYTPDLLGWLTKFGEVSAYYDANGHYARVQSAEENLFHYNQLTQELEPIPPSQQFSDLQFGIFTRCPGGATQPIAGSNPFTDDGSLLAGGQGPNPKCNPSEVPPGP